MAEGDDNDYCPLCMEELDMTDKTFNSCVCGYQVCLWCWHQIKNEYNGLCPACRTPYLDISKQKEQVHRSETELANTKPRKSKEKQERRNLASAKPLASPNRKLLTNVRVMQRNLVYVIGLPHQFADEEMLRSQACFGQYGRIIKAVVNTSNLHSERQNATASAYITFAENDDALKCIQVIDGYILNGSLLRASFGTTKYCNFFLRHAQCNNPDCLYLHQLGEQDDSFTKEEMQSALHAGKGAFKDHGGTNIAGDVRQGTTFPPPRSETSESEKSSSHGRRYRSGRDRRRHGGSEAMTNAQRKAQSAAAVSKLRQSNQDKVKTRHENIKRIGGSGNHRRTQSLSKIAASNSAPFSSPRPLDSKRTSTLRDDDFGQSSEQQSQSGASAKTTEVLELIGLSTGKPAWEQSVQSESALADTDQCIFDPVSRGAVAQKKEIISGYQPPYQQTDNLWKVSADDLTSIALPASAYEQSSITSNVSLNATEPPSSTSLASIDAIFKPRNQSSEALADLLGLNLSSKPLQHGLLQETNCANRSSRFAFANRLPYQHSENDISELPRMAEASGSNSRLLTTNKIHFSPQDPCESPIICNHENKSQQVTNNAQLNSAARDTSGIAFLKKMLPNVNISVGGEHQASCQTQLHSSHNYKNVDSFGLQDNCTNEESSKWAVTASKSAGISTRSHHSNVIHDPALVIPDRNTLQMFSCASSFLNTNDRSNA